MKQSFDFIDLFAGIGGFRIPFEEIGGRSVFSSEWDKFSQETYRANYDEAPAGDITQIRPEDIPPHDLLTGGFPCQPFSNAGLKKGLNDARGTMFFYVAKIIEYHRPKVVLLENVKALLHNDKGRTFETIKRVLTEDLGYTVHYKVLNAKDFGVPQNRERVFIVALRDGGDFEFPQPTNMKTKLGQILEKDPDPKYTISDKLWASHQRRKENHLKKGNGFGYRLFDENSEYTSTISARYYKDGSEILVAQKGKNPRKLTPREASRLQGFPADFKIVVSDVQAYKQFGNAVAVPVIQALAYNLKEQLVYDRRTFAVPKVEKYVSYPRAWEQKYGITFPEAA